MADVRAEVALRPAEVAALLDQQRVIILGTSGPDGRPHLAPMWYLPTGDGRIAMWTYATSQKAANLRREPRATLLVEAGHSYRELRGVSLDVTVRMVEGPDEVAALGARLAQRYDAAEGGGPHGPHGPDVTAAIRHQARRRVGLMFTATRVRSWDHGKL
jgi:PPOX class probable F420-dependent enzyme